MEHMYSEYQRAEAEGTSVAPETDILTPKYNAARASPIMRDRMSPPPSDKTSRKRRRRKNKGKEAPATVSPVDSDTDEEITSPPAFGMAALVDKFNQLPTSWRVGGAAMATVFVTALLYRLVRK